ALGSASDLVWSTDVRLRRSSANSLSMDDGASGPIAVNIVGDLGISDDLSVTDSVFLGGTSYITWGADVTLYRNSADILQSDDRISSIRSGASDLSFTARVSGDSAPRWQVAADGTMTFGSGSATDVTLYRGGSNILRTDDTLYVGDPGGGTGLIVSSGGSIEVVAAGTSYIDFKNAAGDDFDLRVSYDSTNGGQWSGSSLNIASGLVLKVAGTQVVTSRRTGWGAPTGTATRTTFATSTVTTAQLAERVKALIDDLTTHGLIGA
ncbi:MAG TPA: hypothetical protein VLA89_02615, partial [Gemmatimonadales bacterium]|nr:hypothetical protein [Gemmatimonadales bacterium]